MDHGNYCTCLSFNRKYSALFSIQIFRGCISGENSDYRRSTVHMLFNMLRDQNRLITASNLPPLVHTSLSSKRHPDDTTFH